MKKSTLYLSLIVACATSFFVHAQRTPKINLSGWKLSIPEGSTTTFKAPGLLDYASNSEIQKYMFNDPSDRSLVFYSYPSIKSKRSYTKTELKEQNSFGSDIGWSFIEGGKLKVVGKMGAISQKNGKTPRVIFVQVNGRLKEDQANLIGAKGKDAPAILKVYWDNGFIKLRSKKPESLSIAGNDLLVEDSWTDDDGFTFKDRVESDKFTLDIVITAGKMEVTLNNKETKVYSGDTYQKWNVFDNYFTVGCNLQSEEVGAFANMKYMTIEASH